VTTVPEPDDPVYYLSMRMRRSGHAILEKLAERYGIRTPAGNLNKSEVVRRLLNRGLATLKEGETL
jgi:hypothetical protein